MSARGGFVDYAVVNNAGEVFRTGMRCQAAMLTAHLATISALEDINREFPDGLNSAAECAAAISAATFYVTPERLA